MSQIRKGAVLSYVSILLTNVVGLFITPFIVKSLGKSEYGLYTLIGSLVAYLTVMDLGLNNTIVRFVSKYRATKDCEGEQIFLGSVMRVYFIISAIVLVLGVIIYLNLNNFFGGTLTFEQLTKAKIMFVILIFSLMISLPGGTFTAICNAYEEFVFPRTLSVIKYIVRSVLVVFILWWGADAIGLVILDVLINLTAILWSFIYVKRHLKVKYKFKVRNKQFFKEIFSYSAWIFLFALIGQMQWRGGQLIIGATLNTESVAIYAIGLTLGTYYGAFSGAISSLFLPRATQMTVNESSPEELTKMMTKISRFSLFTLILIFIGFIFLGKQFIMLWVGPSYSGSYYIAILIMIGYTVPLIQTFANSLLEAQKLFKFKALVYLACLGTGTILGYIFSAEYGIYIVINFLVGFWILGQIIMNIFFQKKLKLLIFKFFKDTFKGLILVIVVMSILSFLLVQLHFLNGWLDFILKALVIFILYIPTLYYLGMNTEEKTYITQLIKNRFNVSNKKY